MTHLIDYLFGGPGMLPRGACLGWDPMMIAVHATGAGLSAISYLIIPIAILVFLDRREDFDRTARRVAWLFVALFVAAGVSRVVEFLTIWQPMYGLQGLVKIAVACVGVAGAVLVWPQLPRLLRLPSPAQLARANAALAQANASLEATVAWRTHELEMAKQRFEQALSRSNITVFTQDRDLVYTWIHNPRLGLSEEQIIGHKADELLPADAATRSTRVKQRALDTGETLTTTLSVPTGSGGYLYLDMTISPTHDQQGKIDGILCTAVDVTEKRLFEIRLASMAAQLATANQRFELALENSPITVFEQDTELRYTFIENPPEGTRVEDYLGRTDAELFSEADQRRIVPPKRRVFEERRRENVEIDVEIGGMQRFYDLRLEPKLDDAGEVTGVIGTAVDLTERRRTEQQLRLVMRELTHRSKNLLAVIQAMARKTASLAEDTDEFVANFSARLRAISAAHDLLVSRSWSGAGLGDVLRASLVQTVDPGSSQIRMEGPELMLAPDTAQNLGLAFHELTTNATKYGALSTEAGCLTISWERAEGEIRIVWREEGGPEIAGPPERRGFGRVLLERLVGATLNGSVELEFRRAGLSCRIVFPDERLAADEANPATGR